MPYIAARTNVEIPKDKEEVIKSRLGKAITAIGKSESWLMVELVDNCRLYFNGSTSAPVAYVEVKLLGKASAEAYGNLTEEICKILSEELSVKPSDTYVKYEEIEHWGWNGGMF